MFKPLTGERQLNQMDCFLVPEDVEVKTNNVEKVGLDYVNVAKNSIEKVGLIGVKNGMYKLFAMQKNEFKPNRTILPSLFFNKNQGSNSGLDNPNQMEFMEIRQYFKSRSNWHYFKKPEGYNFFNLPDFHIGKGTIYYGVIRWYYVKMSEGVKSI